MTNLGLFGITCSQTAYYFHTYPNDRRISRAAVAILFCMEGVHVAFLTQGAYYAFIVCKLPENVFTAFNITWEVAASITITLIITSAVQSFYAWRIYCLSARYRWRKALVAFILATSLAELGAGLTANALQYGNPSVDVIGTLRSRHAYLVNLTMGITSDLMISASLVYILNAMRTGFKSTENVINRLLVFSMSNGLLTTIISSLILVTYYVEPPPSLLATVFIHISGKLYVNSMLVTLNSRTSIQKMFENTQTNDIILTSLMFTNSNAA
ncbi:hypothetical protein E4T56_gene7027 [Termitomyces sp. T112]|nr:hypothetical protein E4T56_gene7027 [Termitomyces sp. T112]